MFRKDRQGSGTIGGRMSLGLLVALAVVTAAAMAGSVLARPADPTGPAAPGDSALPAVQMSFRLYIDWGQSSGPTNWIEVDSFSWGESHTGSSSGGAGGGAGKVQMQDFVITKRLDKASPKLMEACASGQHLPAVQLDMVAKDGNGKQQQYMIVKMENVLISSYQTGGSSGDTVPMESISLNFEKIEWKYEGPGATPGDVFSWDLSTNTA
jgi:type VI secretion system secreted protein Hcp